MDACRIAFIPLEDLVPLSGSAGDRIVGRRFAVAAGTVPMVASLAPGHPPALAVPLAMSGSELAAGAAVEVLTALRSAEGALWQVLRIGGVNLGLTGATLPAPGQSFTAAEVVDLRQAPPPAPPEGLAAGTPVDTPDGRRPVETLAAGDTVLTRDGRPCPIARVTRREVSLAERIAHPGLGPLILAPGAAGNTGELRLAPAQRVLLTGWRVELLYGRAEALVPASDLIDHRMVRRAPLEGPAVYHRIELDGSGLVTAAGAVLASAGAPDRPAPATEPRFDVDEPALAVARRLDSAPQLRPYQARHLRGR